MTRRFGRFAAFMVVASIFASSAATARPPCHWPLCGAQVPPLGAPDNQDGESQIPGEIRANNIDKIRNAVVAVARLIASPPPGTDEARIDGLRAANVSLRKAYRDLLLDAGSVADGPAASAGNTYNGLTHIQEAALGWRDDLGLALEPIAADLADFVRNLADRIVGAGERAGVDTTAERAALAFGDRLAAGKDYAGSAKQYLAGFDVAQRIKFDIEVFRQNIVSRFQNQTVGFAYSINRAGSHYWSDSSGQARTSADGATSHTEFKEQFVASVSKHVLGTAMLRALQDKNIPVDTPIQAYLPPTWTLHATGSSLTFEDLMTHHSGFAGVSSDWASLRTRIGQSFPSLPDAYDYENANFGMLRILLPRVIGQGQQWDNMEPFFPNLVATMYSLHFVQYVKTVIMDPIGMSASLCVNGDSNDTRYYMFPDDGLAGRIEGNHLLTCGGVGVFVSSIELARFLANLRYSEKILKTETRKEQDEKFLGYTHPDSPAFSGRVGDFGVYHSHGGDWSLGNKDAHACVMKFPINVEVSVVMNSPIGGSPSQCTSLRDAFDNAWVPAF